VLEAQRSGRAIGLEDIKIVRDRVKASRSHRAKLGNWSLGQFRQFVEYKKLDVPVFPCCSSILRTQEDVP
jgi:IS605 OrfB family transposase